MPVQDWSVQDTAASDDDDEHAAAVQPAGLRRSWLDPPCWFRS
jgi:hypothetical protein